MAKKTAPTPAKRDIDFEAALRDVANELREAGRYDYQWRNLNGSYANTEGFCKAATLAEVEASNFVLSPGRYVGSEAEETDGVPFEEKMQQLISQLAAQFEKSAVPEKKIRENLERIEV